MQTGTTWLPASQITRSMFDLIAIKIFSIAAFQKIHFGQIVTVTVRPLGDIGARFPNGNFQLYIGVHRWCA
jgi:hypothetical protein